jgi:hypothetical protein
MLTADERLASIRTKLEWAKKHILNLEGEIQFFLRTEPYAVTVQPDPQTPQAVKYFVARVSEPPSSVSLIVGDILFNLRATLDHLAYHLVLANKVTDERILKATYFPIADNPTKYTTDAPGKVKGMSKAAQDAIAATKPYKGGTDSLWILHKLNNTDKHRLVITVGSSLAHHNLPAVLRRPVVDSVISQFGDLLDPEWIAESATDAINKMTLRPPIRKCPLKVGDELVLALNPIPKTDEEFQISFEVAFSEPGVIESQPVLETLQNMANLVDSIVLSFKPLLV